MIQDKQYMSEMSNHKCAVGVFYDYFNVEMVSIDDIKKLIADKYTIYSLKDYLDRRRSTNLWHFDYCPICGNKIDWGKIRKENM